MYNPMNGAILAKAFSFLQAFLDTSEISSSKFNSSPILCQVISQIYYFQSRIVDFD